MNTFYTDAKKMMLKSLRAMSMLLGKVQTQLPEKGHNEEELLQARLAPDMFPFVKQIQVMSDNAKGAMARFAAKEIPSMPDTEVSLKELVERLNKTIAFVESVSDADLAGADEQKITLPYFPEKYQTAEDYLRDYALPNFYFHFVTAYGILRMKGYDIGKTDFIGGLNLRDL